MNPYPGRNPPGFFHGHYGGPRASASQTNLPNSQRYAFSKTTSENVNMPHPSQSQPKQPSFPNYVEPLNEEILDGCANLFDQIGKRVQVILRDGRILVGELASVDIFSNLLLRDAVERIVVGKQFGDIIRGIFIIRGDNLVLIGEIDCEKESTMENVLQQVPTDDILLAQKLHQDNENAKQLKYVEALKHRGVAFPRPLEDDI